MLRAGPVPHTGIQCAPRAAGPALRARTARHTLTHSHAKHTDTLHVHSHSNTHTCHTQTHTRAFIQTHIHMRTHRHTLSFTNTDAHAYTHAQTSTHAHVRAHTHNTHTDLHTHRGRDQAPGIHSSDPRTPRPHSCCRKPGHRAIGSHASGAQFPVSSTGMRPGPPTATLTHSLQCRWMLSRERPFSHTQPVSGLHFEGSFQGTGTAQTFPILPLPPTCTAPMSPPPSRRDSCPSPLRTCFDGHVVIT